jgi:hypothetical protein
VTVNPGGGSGWDEPPLDIQIPDDARELDRDVLAYHRELRAQRRRNRLRRLTGPFAGQGTVMPLLASILAVCLVAGAMLSVATFSPTAPADHTTRPSATAGAVSPSPPRSHTTTTTGRARPSGTGSGLTSTGAIPASPAGAGAGASATGTIRSASGSARASAAPGKASPSGSDAIRPSALSSSFVSARPSSAAPR